MSEAKPTPGPWLTRREGFSTIYIQASIGGGWVQEIAACGPTNEGGAQQEANASLIADAGTVFHTTGLTPSQLVERVKELRQTLSTIDERLRQCFDDPITAREAYDSFYQKIVAAALSKARPNTAEGE